MTTKPIISRSRYARRRDWRWRGFVLMAFGLSVAVVGCGIESFAFEVGRGILVVGAVAALIGFVIREYNEEG